MCSVVLLFIVLRLIKAMQARCLVFIRLRGKYLFVALFPLLWERFLIDLLIVLYGFDLFIIYYEIYFQL